MMRPFQLHIICLDGVYCFVDNKTHLFDYSCCRQIPFTKDLNILYRDCEINSERWIFLNPRIVCKRNFYEKFMVRAISDLIPPNETIVIADYPV